MHLYLPSSVHEIVALGRRRCQFQKMMACHVFAHPLSSSFTFTRVLSMLPTLRPATGHLFRAVNSNARPFVSTVLLSKSWDNETVADLKIELKKRGLTS